MFKQAIRHNCQVEKQYSTDEPVNTCSVVSLSRTPLRLKSTVQNIKRNIADASTKREKIGLKDRLIHGTECFNRSRNRCSVTQIACTSTRAVRIYIFSFVINRRRKGCSLGDCEAVEMRHKTRSELWNNRRKSSSQMGGREYYLQKARLQQRT